MSLLGSILGTGGGSSSNQANTTTTTTTTNQGNTGGGAIGGAQYNIQGGSGKITLTDDNAVNDAFGLASESLGSVNNLANNSAQALANLTQQQQQQNQDTLASISNLATNIKTGSNTGTDKIIAAVVIVGLLAFAWAYSK